MIAIDRLIAADRRVLEAVGLLLGDEELDILAQRALVAFQREDVIGLLVEDFLGDVALAAHRVDGHDGALDRHHVEQLGDGDDLVRLLRHLDLAEHEALARREGRDHVDRRLARPSSGRSGASVLPSMAITPAGAPVSAATQATKQRWNASASSVAKISPR